MEPSNGREFFEQFIEDYFAECEEHLSTARRVLLELEGLPAKNDESVSARQALFRSLHTLKGLSGMAGVTSAEHVAHVLEDSLRGIERAGVYFDPPTVDTMLAGFDLLERCVEARRSGAAAPDATPEAAAVLERLERLAQRDAAPTRSASSAPAAARDAGTTEPWSFEFTPSAELMKRGVSVETVRQRLTELGTIIDGKPRIVAGGVAFDFKVGVIAGRTPDPAWRADGMQWVEPAAPEPAANQALESGAGSSDSIEAAPAASRGAHSTSSVVRVDLARLDSVMRLVGELVGSRAKLEDALSHANGKESRAAWESIDETSALMERQLRQLREGIMRIRLVPVGEVFERLRFAVRDAARESGKQVVVEVEGQHTEIDKLVVDRILEPLLHLVRNAVSHGIESPATRESLGKPAEGRVMLSATPSGDRIILRVEDDGAGIDVAAVEAQARAHGLLAANQPLDEDSLLDTLCAPGFSTQAAADRTSGRGVGMDAVRSAVRALAGELTLQAEPGRGTSFTIELPLTLMIVDAVIVEVARQFFAVPQLVLREILQVETSSMVTFENNEVLPYRDAVLPVLGLAPLFGLPQERPTSCYVLVIGTEAEPMGLIVDRLHGLREIVVHPVVDPLVTVPGIAGATELGDGRVSLIIDSAAVLRLADTQRQQRKRSRSRAAAPNTLPMPS